MGWDSFFLAFLAGLFAVGWLRSWGKRLDVILAHEKDRLRLAETEINLDEADTCLVDLMDSFEFYRSFHECPEENTWDEYDHTMIPRWKAMGAYLTRRYGGPDDDDQ